MMMMVMTMMVLIKREIILYLPIPFSIDADITIPKKYGAAICEPVDISRPIEAINKIPAS